MNNVLDSLSQDPTVNFDKVYFRDKYVEKYDIIDNVYYIFNDYIIIDSNIDNQLKISIAPQEYNVSYINWFNFVNAKRVMKDIYSKEVSCDNNYLIIKCNNKNRLMEILFTFCSIINYPVKDKYLKHFIHIDMVVNYLNWKPIFNNMSFFVISEDVSINKIKAFTPLGQLIINKQEHLPAIGEHIEDIRIKSNSSVINEYKEIINSSKYMWNEYEDIMIFSKNTKSIVSLRRSFTDIFESMRLYKNKPWNSINNKHTYGSDNFNIIQEKKFFENNDLLNDKYSSFEVIER